MLVLCRKLDESVVMYFPDGTPIKVTVVEIDRDRIRLGFDAPREVEIYRTELIRDGSVIPPPRK